MNDIEDLIAKHIQEENEPINLTTFLSEASAGGGGAAAGGGSGGGSSGGTGSGISNSAGIPGVETLATKPTKKMLKEWGSQFQFEGFKEIISDPRYTNLIMMKKDGSDWIGYISYRLDNKAIYNLEINPKYRRMGYGRKLMDMFPDFQYLHVRPDNEPAIKMYKKMGLTEAPLYTSTDDKDPTQHMMMYNPKTVGPSLFKTDDKGLLFIKINIPEDNKYFFKAYKIVKSPDGQMTKIPLFKKMGMMKSSPEGNSQLVMGADGEHKYCSLNNVNPETPITIQDEDTDFNQQQGNYFNV